MSLIHCYATCMPQYSVIPPGEGGLLYGIQYTVMHSCLCHANYANLREVILCDLPNFTRATRSTLGMGRWGTKPIPLFKQFILLTLTYYSY